MRNTPPIAVCAFGWGQELRLYEHYLDVQGKQYALSDLTHIRPIYHRVMGVDSVRLELRFGKKQVTLRGIAAIDEAQKVIDYLTSQYLGMVQSAANAGTTIVINTVSAAIRTDTEAGAGAMRWNWSRERKKQFKTIPRPLIPAQDSEVGKADETIDDTDVVVVEPVTTMIGGFLDSTLGTETDALGLPLSKSEPLEGENWNREECLREFAQAPTAKVEIPTPNWQRFRSEQRERRQHRLYVERSLREHGFDVERLARKLKEEPLPVVNVPVRLQHGEFAHYSVEATLCGEPVGESIRYTYPAKDHGTLILTNRRMIYIGRKSQIVLDYARLLHLSRLRGAVAFQATHWYRREIFELRRPLECAMFVEAILEQFRRTADDGPDSYDDVPTGYTGYTGNNGKAERSEVAIGVVPRSPLGRSKLVPTGPLERSYGTLSEVMG